METSVLQSKLALTDGTDAILRPVAIDGNEFVDVGISGAHAENFNLYFYRKSRAGATYAPSGVVTGDFVQRLPGAKRVDMNNLGKREIGARFLAPATDTTAIVLLEAWPRRQINYVNNDHGSAHDAAVLLELLRTRVWNQLQGVRTVAEWRAGKPVDCPFEYSGANPLAVYQQVGLMNAQRAAGGYLLLMEQGTGKTPIVIAQICNDAVEYYNRTGQIYKVLIVVPKNVQLNWVYEFDRFATQAGRTTVLRGDKMQRVKLFIDAFRPDEEWQRHASKYSVVITSYEMLSNAWDLLSATQWNLAVLDEGHFIADTKTRRFHYAMELRDRSDKRMILTGTPIRNTVFDLYALWEFLGRGWSGFSSFKAFCRFYGVFEKRNNQTDNYSGFERLIGVQNMPFIKERLARTAFVTKKAEALPDLPPKVYDVIEVEMSTEQQLIYDQVANSLSAEIEDMLDSSAMPKQLLVTNILTQLLRLAEITSGYVRWDEVCNPVTNEVLRPQLLDRFDPNPKLDTLLELLTAKKPEQKTIVWTCFVENIKTIRARLALDGINAVVFYGETSVKERDAAVNAFNCDPETRVFIGNPVAGGTGLNLIGYDRDDEANSHSYCDHVIYYAQNWSAPARSQSEDRAHRRGTRNNVRITDLCVPNSVDEEIRMRVLQKIKLGLEVSDIREIISRILRKR